MTQTSKALVFITDDLGSVDRTQMAPNKNSVTPSLDDLTPGIHVVYTHISRQNTHTHETE